VITVHHSATRCQFTSMFRYGLPEAGTVDDRVRAALGRTLVAPIRSE
jgi:hypothetical protein